jgi:hypothetical protein
VKLHSRPIVISLFLVQRSTSITRISKREFVGTKKPHEKAWCVEPRENLPDRFKETFSYEKLSVLSVTI